MAKDEAGEPLKSCWIPEWLHQKVSAIARHNGETITEVLTRYSSNRASREYRKVVEEMQEQAIGGEG